MKYPLLALIKLYQWTISPLLGPVCRYYPSCSHYGFTAIDRHGAVKGTALTAWRILRCNPWSPGGWTMFPLVSARAGTKCCATRCAAARAGTPLRRARPQRPRPMLKEPD